MKIGRIVSFALMPLVSLVFFALAANGAFLSRDSAPLIFAGVFTAAGLVDLILRRRDRPGLRALCILPACLLAVLSIQAHKSHKAELRKAVESRAEAILLAQPAPELPYLHSFNVKDNQGASPTFPRKGVVTVVDFWATWCAPCLSQMPDLQDQYEKHGSQGLEIVGITRFYGGEDSEKELTEIADVLRSLEVSYPVLVVESDRLHQQYYVEALPSSILVDESGTIIDYGAGSDGTREVLARAVALAGDQDQASGM